MQCKKHEIANSSAYMVKQEEKWSFLSQASKIVSNGDSKIMSNRYGHGKTI